MGLARHAGDGRLGPVPQSARPGTTTPVARCPVEFPGHRHRYVSREGCNLENSWLPPRVRLDEDYAAPPRGDGQGGFVADCGRPPREHGPLRLTRRSARRSVAAPSGGPRGAPAGRCDGFGPGAAGRREPTVAGPPVSVSCFTRRCSIAERSPDLSPDEDRRRSSCGRSTGNTLQVVVAMTSRDRRGSEVMIRYPKPITGYQRPLRHGLPREIPQRWIGGVEPCGRS